jgi:HAD superfamily hydrolase (TIGR01459 family)
MTNVIDGILGIADQYDSFVFDQFGVLHDGKKPYANVTEVLRHLKGQNKKILMLTNSGRSAEANYSRLSTIGIAGDSIDVILTSGDTAKDHLLPHYVREKGTKCYRISSANETPESLTSAVKNLQVVDNIADCDFVYLSGMPEGLAETWATDLLPKLVAAGAPMLCSNPDFVAPVGSDLMISPGTIAKAYEDAGGPVERVGKPFPIIYDVVKQHLEKLNCHKTLCVGDSYHHDIFGAHNAEFDSFLVLTGVHKALFQNTEILPAFQAYLFQDGISPTWISHTL